MNSTNVKNVNIIFFILSPNVIIYKNKISVNTTSTALIIIQNKQKSNVLIKQFDSSFMNNFIVNVKHITMGQLTKEEKHVRVKKLIEKFNELEEHYSKNAGFFKCRTI